MANKRSGSSSSRSTKPGRTTPPKSAPSSAASRPAPRPVPPKAPTPSKRVTPKGTGTTSGRYTPPIPKEVKVSPIWVPILMFSCLLLGMAMIITNYVSLLPASPSNGWLLGGLGLITVGFITATKFH
ncbi:MAG: cell division protein CrgA [Acidimicrobiales bacterium]